MEKDPAKAVELLVRASNLGNKTAQYELGRRYAEGRGVNKDLEAARYHLRFCATGGIGVCQYVLGKLLLEIPNVDSRTRVQGTAWLDLAATAEIPEAMALIAEAKSKLSADQLKDMESLLHRLQRPKQK